MHQHYYFLEKYSLQELIFESMRLEIKFSTFIRYRIDRTLRDLITKKNEPYFFIHTRKLNHAAYHIQFFNLKRNKLHPWRPESRIERGKIQNAVVKLTKMVIYLHHSKYSCTRNVQLYKY